MCPYECPQIPKTPSIGQSLGHHQHEQENKTQQKFKIQTPQVSNGLFLFVMSCNPKNYVICLLL
jgi:hypothetical protein